MPKKILFSALVARGHFNPTVCLARELGRRHHVMFVTPPDGKTLLRSIDQEMPCRVFAEHVLPPGYIFNEQRMLGELSGFKGLVNTGDRFQRLIRARLDTLPPVLREERPDLMVVDQSTPDVGAVAESLGIPWVTISPALLFNQQADLPPYYTPFTYGKEPWAKARNSLFNLIYQVGNSRATRQVRRFRIEHGLRLEERGLFGVSQTAQLCPLHKELDFPRANTPDSLHFVGPWFEKDRDKDIDFPFDRLTGAPLVYGSFGTLQNRVRTRYYQLAEACRSLDVQLVLSLGGGADVREFSDLPGNPIVANFVPQLEILKRAKLFVTHAGLNGVEESLSHGVPMVAIPITNDQPGVAARVAWNRVGVRLTHKDLTVAKLRSALTEVLANSQYAGNARRHQGYIAQSGGVERAAKIVESVA